ncbi:hypothetical protein [Rhizobium sp. GN54]|uniref:hypothetical protein n=1 Tax=Rhizobium sp. GN54 TaxID=2898150 RepID=UPI001E4CCB23|nr:hypothetical protein [Rhizobium sp. GN54]MCD2183559.1 hypothetical protein [Rhizobium sp. GN54]
MKDLLRQVHVLSIERDMLQTKLDMANSTGELLSTAAHDDIVALRENAAIRFNEIAATTIRLIQANQQIEQLKTLNSALVARSAELDAANRQLIQLRRTNNALVGRLTEVEERWPNRVWERIAKLTRRVRKTLWIIGKRTLGRAYVIARRRRDAEALAIVRHSVLFHESWYRRQYLDVRRTGLSPVEDYFYFGATEGRSPGPDFDSSAYYEAYPFVARTGLNALIHYETVGKAKGRRIWPVKKSQ